MVISAAEFLENEEARNETKKYFDARVYSLELAYSIPGYREAPTETKNFFYDAIIRKVTNLMNI